MAKDFKTRLKEKFAFDVSSLPNYTDEQSTDFILTLIESSNFLSKFTVEEGVKGSKTIKMLNMDAALQEMTGCSLEPDGSVVFTGKNIVTKRLGMSIEFCNEDLNGKWTQMLNVIGSNRQDSEMVLEPVLVAYMGELLKRKAQRLVVLGDTTSIDPDLAHFDGLSKKMTADADVVSAISTETAWTVTNAFSLAKLIASSIPHIVFDKGLQGEVILGRTELQLVIDNIYNSKDFNALTVAVTDENGVLSLVLPTTNVRFTSVPELTGTGEAYFVVYPYQFIGTDLESDMDTIEIKYDDYNNKLKAQATFRLGYEYVMPTMQVKLVLAAS